MVIQKYQIVFILVLLWWCIWLFPLDRIFLWFEWHSPSLGQVAIQQIKYEQMQGTKKNSAISLGMSSKSSGWQFLFGLRLKGWQQEHSTHPWTADWYTGNKEMLFSLITNKHSEDTRRASVVSLFFLYEISLCRKLRGDHRVLQKQRLSHKKKIWFSLLQRLSLFFNLMINLFHESILASVHLALCDFISRERGLWKKSDWLVK